MTGDIGPLVVTSADWKKEGIEFDVPLDYANGWGGLWAHAKDVLHGRTRSGKYKLQFWFYAETKPTVKITGLQWEEIPGE